MTIAINTKIKHIENSFEDFNEFGIEIDLGLILIEEFNKELASDINNCA